MAKTTFKYAVIEVDLDGKINLGVSHWFFSVYSDALAFANEIGSNNTECKFYIISMAQKGSEVLKDREWKAAK